MQKSLAIFIVILALGLSFILIGRSQNSNRVVGNIHQAAVTGNSGETQLAPDINLNLLNGGTVNLSDYRGKKPVVLNFWASWCPNCRRNIPNLNQFYEKYKDRVEVIGVNLHEETDTVRKFISSLGISFPIALDPNSVASRAYGIQYTNTHFLIDKEGRLIRTVPGDIQESDVQYLIQRSGS